MVVVLVLVVVVVVGGGVILGEVKARPKDIISFSLDYICKSKVQTSNPSSSPISLDTPARPADFGATHDSLHFITIGLLAQPLQIYPCRIGWEELTKSQS